jgi:hypothetical protein
VKFKPYVKGLHDCSEYEALGKHVTECKEEKDNYIFKGQVFYILKLIPVHCNIISDGR